MRKFLRSTFFSFILLCVFCGCTYESSLLFDCEPYKSAHVIALNKNARHAQIQNPENSSYAYFAFSQDQLSFIKAVEASHKAVSFNAVISVLPQKKQTEEDKRFAFGLLYDEDFNTNGKLKKNLDERPIIIGYLNDRNNRISVSLAVPKNSTGNIKGLFLYSEIPSQLVKSSIIPAELGFDFSSDIPSYFLGIEGGVISNKNPYSVTNFSAAQKLFTPDDINFNRMPVISVGFENMEIQPQNPVNQVKVELDIGKEKIHIRRTKGLNNMTFYCSGLKNPYSKVVPVSNENQINSIRMRYENVPFVSDAKVVHPLETDPGMIPLWNKDNWRTLDYELFCWQQFPNLLFFDTLNYSVQDEFFKRLAFFTEKTGYVGTLVSDKEMYGKHGFNAHDYRSDTLADFFTLACETNFPLNSKEILLRDILVYNKIIIPVIEDNVVVSYRAGTGGVISVSQESAMYLRYTFICHEGLHGLYFIDKGFRQYVSKVFNQTDTDSLLFLFCMTSLQIYFRNPLILFRKMVTSRCCNRINEMQSESHTGMIPGI